MLSVNLSSSVIDYGIASIELVMEDALQDIPPLVYDIQERLKGWEFEAIVAMVS